MDHHPVQAGQVGGGVEAVPGRRTFGGTREADLVPMVERAHGDARTGRRGADCHRGVRRIGWFYHALSVPHGAHPSGPSIPISRRYPASVLSGSNGRAAVMTTRAPSGVRTSTSTVFHGVRYGPETDPGRSFSQAVAISSIWPTTHEKLTVIVGSPVFPDPWPGTSRTSWNAQRRRWVILPGTVKKSKNPRPRVQNSADPERSSVGTFTNTGMP